VNILGCPFAAISFDETVARLSEAVLGDGHMQIVPGSIDTIAKLRRHSDFGPLLWRCDLVVADGKPIVWFAALLKDPIRGRVSGTELVWKCAELSAQTGFVVALIGGAGDVAERAAIMMKRKFPEAKLQPIVTPFPLGAKESEKVVEAVRNCGAKIVLAALGAPRQEKWIHDWLPSSEAAVGIGIGSAFDIISGDRPRAPQWMQDAGLEWFYRMLQEPRRLGRRYLIENLPVLGWLAHELLCRAYKNGKRCHEQN
jgi:N-acetylglucosaminyldiphosphoundecaprenol N-acetyl-beta-D-mannosaminyltransferase